MQEQEKQTAKGRDLYEWVQSLVGSVLVVVAIFTFVIRMMGVDGHSMLNTLQHGDRLLVVNSMLYHDYTARVFHSQKAMKWESKFVNSVWVSEK